MQLADQLRPSAHHIGNGFAGLLQSNGSLSTTNIVHPSIQSYGISNKTSHTESYNLSTQYATGTTMSVTVGYVGNVYVQLRQSNVITDSYDSLLAPGTFLVAVLMGWGPSSPVAIGTHRAPLGVNKSEIFTSGGPSRFLSTF